MRPAHPETEETAHMPAATPASVQATHVPQTVPRTLSDGRPVSLAEVWEAIELWWLAFLMRLRARGEHVPLCPCCEAKMCGLEAGVHASRSAMGVYLAAAPHLSARARRHLARGIAGRLRAMRACGESWRGWVRTRVSHARTFATVRRIFLSVSDLSLRPLRVGAGRGPPGFSKDVSTEPCGSPTA